MMELFAPFNADGQNSTLLAVDVDVVGVVLERLNGEGEGLGYVRIRRESICSAM